MKTLRILIISHFYPPEMGGAAARVHGLARWLSAFGHHVTVVTGFPSYPSGSVPSAYRGKLMSQEKLEGVIVFRTWSYISSHRRKILRLANYFSFVVSAVIICAMKSRRFDVILASSPPLFVGLAGMTLAQFYGIPWVLDIRDIWPDVAVEAGEFRRDALITYWGSKLAHFLYKQADHITPVTENKRHKLLAAGVDVDKLSIVTNGVDLDKIRNLAESHWRRELDLIGRFVVVYAGLIGIAQGLDVVVEAAQYLRDHSNIHFLIVGGGVQRNSLVKRAVDLNLTNIRFLPSQPREVTLDILGSADVAIVPLATKQLNDAVPSKLLEAWACRKPVLLVASGEAAQIVEQAQGGIVIPTRDPRLLADAIIELSEDRSSIERYANNGYTFVTSHFDRRALAREMEEVLFEISCKGSR